MSDERDRIDALQNDSEMQELAATARPRGPIRAPHHQEDDAGKQAILCRLADLKRAAADPNREQEIERRYQEQRSSREKSTIYQDQANGAKRRKPRPNNRQASSNRHTELVEALVSAGGPAADPIDAAAEYANNESIFNDEIVAALARLVYYERTGNKCPPTFIPAWRDLCAWDCGVDVAKAIEEGVCALLGKESYFVSWPWNSQRATRNYRVAVGSEFEFEGKFYQQVQQINEVHLRWARLSEPRPRHFLADLVDAWQKRPFMLSDARVSIVNGTTRSPYAVSDATRRTWQLATDVTSVNVDGKPLAARLQDVRPKNSLGWLYVDDPTIMPTNGTLLLPDPSFSIYPQNALDMPLTMVASRMLGNLDGRNPLRGDVRTVLTVTFASTKAVAWTDEEGARLLARTKTGGFRRPERSDIKRWRTAVEVADSIRLYYQDQHGRAWVRLLVADPYGDGRTIISPPAWFREHVSESATSGASMGYTLTGAAHPSRQIGAKSPSYPHVIASMEYWIARSFNGKAGVAPLLKPVRPGGPGPWAPARHQGDLWYWYDVLTLLALERFDLNSKKARDAALERYWRIVDGFKNAGYTCHGDAGPGDTVEIEASQRRRGRATPWLRFRATARFCEAARLAQAGKWSTTPLLAWYGVDEPSDKHDEPSDKRQ